MKLICLILLSTLSLFPQTAITELTAFWEGNVTAADRILWDSKGSAHGMYWGKGITLPASVFSGGVNTVLASGEQGGMGVPGALVVQSGTFAYGVWCRHTGSDTILNRANSGAYFNLKFNTGNGGFPQVTVKLTDGSTATEPAFTYPLTANNGDLTLVWFAYDNADGSIKVAMNGGSWSSSIPASAVLYNMTGNLNFANTVAQFASDSVAGRTMFWNGYIPTDGERTAIYNGGAGVDFTYFNSAGFTPPTRPLTATLVDATFADDAALPTNQKGLYWLRPFPVKDWGASVRASFGFDYAWVRTPDHAGGGGVDDAVFIGGSNSPAILPTSWATLVNAAQLSAADPTKNWTQMHPPFLVWNPDTNKVHLYHTAMLDPYDAKWSVHLWTSPDMSTWTWIKETIPYGQTIDGEVTNHAGYATVVRNGTGDWVAQSLINSTITTARWALWTSTDGVDWTFSALTNSMQGVTLAGNPVEGWNPLNSSSTYICGGVWGGQGNFAYMGYHGTSLFEAVNPMWMAFDHGGTGTGNDFLIKVSCYEEAGTVYMYAKWSYQQPSTVRLYTGTLSEAQRRAIASGGIRFSGGAKVQ